MLGFGEYWEAPSFYHLSVTFSRGSEGNRERNVLREGEEMREETDGNLGRWDMTKQTACKEQAQQFQILSTTEFILPVSRTPAQNGSYSSKQKLPSSDY